jgi:hypothetical protein
MFIHDNGLEWAVRNGGDYLDCWDGPGVWCSTGCQDLVALIGSYGARGNGDVRLDESAVLAVNDTVSGDEFEPPVGVCELS